MGACFKAKHDFLWVRKCYIVEFCEGNSCFDYVVGPCPGASGCGGGESIRREWMGGDFVRNMGIDSVRWKIY